MRFDISCHGDRLDVFQALKAGLATPAFLKNWTFEQAK